MSPTLPKLSILFSLLTFLAAIVILGSSTTLYIINSKYSLTYTGALKWREEVHSYVLLQEQDADQWQGSVFQEQVSRNSVVKSTTDDAIVNQNSSNQLRKNATHDNYIKLNPASLRSLASLASVSDLPSPVKLKTEGEGTTAPTPPSTPTRVLQNVATKHGRVIIPTSQQALPVGDGASESPVISSVSLQVQHNERDKHLQTNLQTSEPLPDQLTSPQQPQLQTSDRQDLNERREQRLRVHADDKRQISSPLLSQMHASLPYVSPTNNMLMSPLNSVRAQPVVHGAQDTLQSSSHPGNGFVLSVSYYEQQSMGSRNLFQLQCWASLSGLRVVKPVMKDSNLRTPLDVQLQQTMLRFEDHFNLDQWSRYTRQEGYAPLVEWKEFLAKAPRSVILVQFGYSSVTLLKARQRAGEQLLHPPQGERYKSGCESNWPTGNEVAFLKSRGFSIIRKVCFNFYYGDQLTLEEFNKHLLGNRTSFSDVTVVMDMWRGFGSAQRVLIKDVCATVARVQEHVAPSDRILRDADRYIKSYLHGRPYLAIMGRLEMSMLTTRKKVPFCLQETLRQWEAFKTDVSLQTTFLSIDIGKYGSKKFRSNVEPSLSIEVAKFFRGLFGSLMTSKQWEKQFVTVSQVRDAGYIGLLQKVIVTRAQCILFVGGGAFQRHSLHLYQELHRSPGEQCVRVVRPCTSSNKFEL